jgi:alcohol dehydrogenase (cytochrome c)
VLIASGKMGYVYQIDPRTGRTLWKTPVGKHNGHDNDNLYALRGETDKLPELPFEVFPGVLGGVISPIAVAGDTIYASVNNFGATWITQEPPMQMGPFSEGKGELVALDLATGRIKWSHPLDASPYGAASVTNDLVFTTTFDGTLHAVNTRTGRTAWQAKLPAHTNSAVAIHDRYVLTGSGWPQGPGETAEIVAYELDRKGR